jgi:ABC-type Fe3+/spermidine/putrescine transport system ATPase subunit
MSALSRLGGALDAGGATVVLRPAAPGPVVRVRGLGTDQRAAEGDDVVALDGVSFDVHAGELVVFTGAPGSGLRTLLHAVAGRFPPDRGTVEVEVPTGARPADPLALPDAGPPRLHAALAPAVVAGPPVMVLDEPLADVHPRWRPALRADLVAFQRRLGLTMLVATRDQAAAMQLADRLGVLDGGSLVQLDHPSVVYREPRSRAVAALTGTANELPGRLAGDAPTPGTVRVDTPVGEVTGRSGPGCPDAIGAVVAVWRPERTQLAREEPDAPNRWPVTVEASLYLGAHTQHVVRAAGRRFLIWQDDAGGRGRVCWHPGAGDRAWVHVDPGDVRILPEACP